MKSNHPANHLSLLEIWHINPFKITFRQLLVGFHTSGLLNADQSWLMRFVNDLHRFLVLAGASVGGALGSVVFVATLFSIGAAGLWAAGAALAPAFAFALKLFL